MARVTLDHLVGWFKTGVGDFSHRQLLMICPVRADHRSIGDEGEVNPRVGYQIGLELIEVNIQGSVKPEKGGINVLTK